MIANNLGHVTLPHQPRKGMALLPWCRDVQQAIRQLAGRKVDIRNGGKGGSGGPTNCPFGEIVESIVEEATVYSILGGIVYCGDKNFNVVNKSINTGTDGAWLVSLVINCQSNRDDDNEVILPGILTSADTDPSTFWTLTAWTGAEQYPSNDNPDVSTGLGIVVVPLGRLTIASGIPTFIPADCGNIWIDQCAGTLTSDRNPP